MSRLFAVLLSALLALCAGNAFAQAAYVHDMTGTATATVGNTQRALKIGDTVETGTIVSTGDRSTAVIKFEDGQIMALAERSSFRIVEYRYVKQRVSASNAVFALLRGGLRFVSGVIGSTNRNSFRVVAGTSTIGIRGTDGSITYDPVTQAVVAAVSAGALAMDTPLGPQTIGVGQFASFTPGQPPTIPAPTAQATAAVQQVLSSLASQTMPINTPVVVAASARAAAAQANAKQLAAQAAAKPGDTGLQLAAQQAADQAQQALAAAITAAQDAYQSAINGGAVPPAPPAPPVPLPLPPSGDTGTTTDTTATSTSTGTTSTPTGGAGAGGGGTGTTASPN